MQVLKVLPKAKYNLFSVYFRLTHNKTIERFYWHCIKNELYNYLIFVFQPRKNIFIVVERTSKNHIRVNMSNGELYTFNRLVDVIEHLEFYLDFYYANYQIYLNNKLKKDF